MVIKRGSNAKDTIFYLYATYDMTQSMFVFSRYPLLRVRLIMGRLVELRTPLEDFLLFKKKLLFNCVYAHILNINCKNILILKIIEYRRFQCAESP